MGKSKQEAMESTKDHFVRHPTEEKEERGPFVAGYSWLAKSWERGLVLARGGSPGVLDG